MHVTIVMLSALCVGCQCDVNFTNYYRPCPSDAPDPHECLISAVQDGVVKVAAGVPELGVRPLDPLVIDKLHFDYSNRQITSKVQMTNIKMVGLKNAKIKAVRVHLDLSRFRLEVEAVQGGMDVEGDYRAQGHYNTIHVDSRGRFNATIRKIKYTWEFDGVPEKRDGVLYCRIMEFHMRPEVADMRFHVSNLFPKNPELSELANNVSNQNWRMLYRELLPLLQQKWNPVALYIANQIFLDVPCEELFPQRSKLI